MAWIIARTWITVTFARQDLLEVRDDLFGDAADIRPTRVASRVTEP